MCQHKRRGSRSVGAAPGTKLTGDNAFESVGDGRVRCTKTVRVTGLLVPLFRFYFGRRILRDMFKTWRHAKARWPGGSSRQRHDRAGIRSLLSAGFWLHHAALTWRAELVTRLQPLGLTPTQFLVLAATGGWNTCTVHQPRRLLSRPARIE
jgi:hypothetical protein